MYEWTGHPTASAGTPIATDRSSTASPFGFGLRTVHEHDEVVGVPHQAHHRRYRARPANVGTAAQTGSVGLMVESRGW